MSLEELLVKIAYILMHEYGFVRVEVRNLKSEIWLSHLERTEANLIRLHIDSGFKFDRVEARTAQITKAIQAVFKQDLSFVELMLDENEVGHLKTDRGLSFHVSLERMPEPLLELFPKLNQTYQESSVTLSEMQKYIEPKKASTKPLTLMDRIKLLPKTTTLIIALLSLITLIINGTSLLGYDLYATSIFFGAYYKTFILASHEYWRLLTYGLIHIDFFHLMMNSLALSNLGQFVERLYGPKKLIMTLLAGILMGALFVFVAQGNVLLVGISAGLYAILGLMVMYLFESGLIAQPAIQGQLWRTLMINILINFVPNVSVLGHVGGFVAGVLLGLVFSKTDRFKSLKIHGLASLILLSVALIAVGLVDPKQTPLYPDTDLWVIEMAEDFNLKDYAKARYDDLYRYYQEVNR